MLKRMNFVFKMMDFASDLMREAKAVCMKLCYEVELVRATKLPVPHESLPDAPQGGDASVRPTGASPTSSRPGTTKSTVTPRPGSKSSPRPGTSESRTDDDGPPPPEPPLGSVQVRLLH